jgi:GntR family transcriptional regulator/MocR family aminotransferase
MKGPAGLLIPPLRSFPSEAAVPLYAQVYRRVRDVIMSGSLAAGQRLPSARSLAGDIGASRTTVEAAYAQLWAEGFIVRRVGSGTYVAPALPGVPPMGGRGAARRVPEKGRGSEATLARRGRALDAAGRQVSLSAPLWFSSCVPALDLFPVDIWNRLVSRRARHLGTEALAQAPPAGVRVLREAITAHIAAARGVRCDWRQVLVLSSTQQALDLTARLLLDEGESVWFEEPGYLGGRAALAGAGGRLVPVAVDGEGLVVERARAGAPAARLAYVTPSHQFPLGVTLSLPRRLQLIDWARRERSWVFEDDYDSEFRYTGHPLTALHGLDENGRVLYAGTFNKMLFPGVRLAFLVLPETLIEPFVSALGATSGSLPTLSQYVLADFLSEGHFAAHLRRVRQLHGERRDALLIAVQKHLGDRVRLGPVDTGLHSVAWLPRGTNDAALSSRAADAGMDLPPLSRYYLERPAGPGLLITYAGEAPERIGEGMRRLGRLVGGGR